MELIRKLYNHAYPPIVQKKEPTNNKVFDATEKGGDKSINAGENVGKSQAQILDDYNDDFQRASEQSDDDDEWNFDTKPKLQAQPLKNDSQQKKSVFDDLEVLDQKPTLNTKQEDKKKKEDDDNGLFVDNDFGDDFEDEDDEQNKDIFNDSKDKKNATAELKEDADDEDQEKIINEQFKMIYDQDEQLRQLLGDDISKLSLEERYQILNAYIQGGGVAGLMEAEEQDEGKDIEEEFMKIYEQDPKLREVLGTQPSNLNLEEKYQILVAYKKGGGVQALLEEGEDDEESFFEHNGKKFKKVQIEGENQEYLMDEEGNIYDENFEFVGQANGDDDEE